MFIFEMALVSSPEPMAQEELFPSSVVRRASSCVVNNCFRGHLLLNYKLDFDQTFKN